MLEPVDLDGGHVGGGGLEMVEPCTMPSTMSGFSSRPQSWTTTYFREAIWPVRRSTRQQCAAFAKTSCERTHRSRSTGRASGFWWTWCTPSPGSSPGGRPSTI
jgi:hypothetical protein